MEEEEQEEEKGEEEDGERVKVMVEEVEDGVEREEAASCCAIGVRLRSNS